MIAMLKRDLTDSEYIEFIKRQIREMELSANHVYSRKGQRDIERRIEWLRNNFRARLKGNNER